MELEEKEEAAARALEQEANSPLEAVAGGRDQHEEEEEEGRGEAGGGGGHPPAPAQHEEEGTGKPILPYSSMFFLSSDNMQVFIPTHC